MNGISLNARGTNFGKTFYCVSIFCTSPRPVYADACQENGVVLLCRSSSTASDPPICTYLHIPEAGIALVHSRLDYGNGVLVGIPAHLMRRLQSALNAAARLIFNLKRSDHITDALVSLHWLRVPERIQYKIAVLSYKVLHDTAPRYLGPLTRVADADIPGRRALRCASTDRLEVPY